MRVAIAADRGMVAQHFGRCPYYQIYDLHEDKILSPKTIANPGHEPGLLPKLLASYGVHCVVAGGIGHKAQVLFGRQGIDLIMGVVGPVDEIIKKLSQGSLQGGDSLCDHLPDATHVCAKDTL